MSWAPSSSTSSLRSFCSRYTGPLLSLTTSQMWAHFRAFTQGVLMPRRLLPFASDCLFLKFLKSLLKWHLLMGSISVSLFSSVLYSPSLQHLNSLVCCPNFSHLLVPVTLQCVLIASHTYIDVVGCKVRAVDCLSLPLPSYRSCLCTSISNSVFEW